MLAPVTRGELREELQRWVEPLATKAELEPLATKAELERLATKEDLKLLATKAELEPLATKAELAAAIAPLATKAELAAAIAPLATKVEMMQTFEIWGGALLARMDAMKLELQADLARHVKASQEWMMAQMRAHDEQYADLPGRVKRLESTVFGKKKR